MRTSISKTLVRLRKKNARTREEVAVYLQIPVVTYIQYEQGFSEPPLYLIMKLAKYYHRTVEDIIHQK